MDSEDNITLETLLPLREFMSTSQLERFGDYIANRKPSKPFTAREIKELQSMRDYIMEARRRFQERLLRDKDKQE